MKKLGLLEVLEGLEDNRRQLSVRYPLHEVLFMLLVAIICGATSYVKVEMFARNREQWLRKYIRLENKQLMIAKRQHWGIENGLHWVLDMQFREDESRARKDNSAENLNVLRHMAYNVLKSDTTVKGSFSDKQYKCLLSADYLDSVLAHWFCS